MINFICLENTGITIVSNLVTSQSDFQVMERYVKNIENVRSNDVQILRLSQLKSYLKIIRILYFVESTNTSIRSDNIEVIIKANHIFNDLFTHSKTESYQGFFQVWHGSYLDQFLGYSKWKEW